ncbi:MAG: TonB family protein [Deltaproteobacteria bacterium]|nr:TonB family protein [Deltaproteobacteria bacterium]
MTTSMRRHRRVPSSTIWAAVIATTLFVHGILLGTADELGPLLIGEGFSPMAHAATKRAEPVDLATNCPGDVMLATSVRAVMCLAPWRGDVPGCADEVEMVMWMDLSACDRGEERADTPIAMAMVEPRQLQKLTPIDPEPLLDELAQQQQAPPTPPPPQPQVQQQPQQPPPPAPPPPKRPSQVVETVKPNTEQEPDNARFLAEHNTKVEKQQVARGARNEPMVAKSKPEELTPKDKPKDDPSIEKQPDKPPGKNPKAPDAPGTLAMRPPGAPAPTELPQDAKTLGAQGKQGPIVSDGFIPRRGDGAVEQQRHDPGELTKGQGGAGGGEPPMPNLKPSKEQLERIVGGGSVDHLEDVDHGDETALSAKRWVYASFFNRLKRQVAQNWDPQTVWRRTDPSGTHHGSKTRVTEVRVSLSGKGQLAKIVVTSPSGVNELDDEAVRAFHAAAPFPNPPDGLVKDGAITFAFAFYFEIGEPRSSWRVIRSN